MVSSFSLPLSVTASRSLSQGECVVLRDRKLNIAPAIKKQVSWVNDLKYNHKLELRYINGPHNYSQILCNRLWPQMEPFIIQPHRRHRLAISRWISLQLPFIRQVSYRLLKRNDISKVVISAAIRFEFILCFQGLKFDLNQYFLFYIPFLLSFFSQNNTTK